MIELASVVAIMGTVTAIAIPRLSSTSENAAQAAVIGSRDALQRAIDLYAAEHYGAFPHEGAATKKQFYLRLVSTTDLDGSLSDTGIFGPYIDGIPINPINGLGTIRFDGDAPGAETDGWRYDTASGSITPDHDPARTGFIGGGVSKSKAAQAALEATAGVELGKGVGAAKGAGAGKGG